jgi:DNA-binding CsgD family transcriptional regulator
MTETEPPGSLTSLAAALTALFVPTEFTGQDRWGRGVARAVGDAVCADHAVLVVRSPNRLHVYADGASGEAAAIYGRPAHAEAHAVAVRPSPGAWCRRALNGTVEGRIYDAKAVADLAYDAVGVTAETDLPGVRASVICYHRTTPTHQDLRRHLETLALLRPAIAASVRARADAARERHTLTRLLDAMRQGVALYDVAGVLLHENPAFARILAQDPESARLARACATAARGITRSATDRPFARFTPPGDGTPCPEVRVHVDTSSGRYALHAQLVGPDVSPRGGTVAVTLEPCTAESTTASLRKRYGLTDRELDVTRLLSAGRSNADIASTLGISPYTARHHTESVLAKLGVRSRAEVPRLVLSGDAEPLIGAG